MKKDNFFWFSLAPTAVIITLIISLTPWLFETAATPADRVFTGINRWSGDYFTYLSYVELGRRGELGAKLLATTIPQKPVITHLAHTLPGFIFGHLIGFNSIISYHVARSLYGLIFVILTLVFFYRLTKDKTITFIAFLFTFYISGLAEIESLFPLKFSRYLDWLQEQNIIGRATGPLHYNAGFIFFILAFLWFFTVKAKLIKKILILGLLLNLILLANPFAFLIMGLSFAVYILINFLSAKNADSKHMSRVATTYRNNAKPTSLMHVREDAFEHWKNELLTIIGSFILTLPLFLYNQHFLSQEPWGRLGVTPKYYIVTHPPLPFLDTIMSIGPIFFLGIAGIILYLLQKAGVEILGSRQRAEFFQPAAGSSTGGKKIETGPIFLFLIIWLAVQFFLFFFGDYVKIDPLRSFNGLYYLPLSLFSALFIYSLTSKLKQWLPIMFILFLITLPNYYLSYKQQLFAFTDFKTFSNFTYPSKKQIEAFSWLEKNTPVASGVLAMYEASSLMIGLSGNSAEVNMNQNLKIPFYTNQFNDAQAYQFLKNNHFRYIYYGYQEQSVGGNIEKYPFLKKIFENEEVRIYQAL